MSDEGVAHNYNTYKFSIISYQKADCNTLSASSPLNFANYVNYAYVNYTFWQTALIDSGISSSDAEMRRTIFVEEVSESS